MIGQSGKSTSTGAWEEIRPVHLYVAGQQMQLYRTCSLPPKTVMHDCMIAVGLRPPALHASAPVAMFRPVLSLSSFLNSCTGCGIYTVSELLHILACTSGSQSPCCLPSHRKRSPKTYLIQLLPERAKLAADSAIMFNLKYRNA